MENVAAFKIRVPRTTPRSARRLRSCAWAVEPLRESTMTYGTLRLADSSASERASPGKTARRMGPASKRDLATDVKTSAASWNSRPRVWAAIPSTRARFQARRRRVFSGVTPRSYMTPAISTWLAPMSRHTHSRVDSLSVPVRTATRSTEGACAISVFALLEASVDRMTRGSDGCRLRASAKALVELGVSVPHRVERELLNGTLTSTASVRRTRRRVRQIFADRGGQALG